MSSAVSFDEVNRLLRGGGFRVAEGYGHLQIDRDAPVKSVTLRSGQLFVTFRGRKAPVAIDRAEMTVVQDHYWALALYDSPGGPAIVLVAADHTNRERLRQLSVRVSDTGRAQAADRLLEPVRQAVCGKHRIVDLQWSGRHGDPLQLIREDGQAVPVNVVPEPDTDYPDVFYLQVGDVRLDVD